MQAIWRALPRGRRNLAALVAVLAVLSATFALTSTRSANAGPSDTPISPEFLANTLSRAVKLGSVDQNVIPGAIAKRDKAEADWKAAQQKYRELYAIATKPGATAAQKDAARKAFPDPRAKPEYNLVWSGKQNVADIHADVISKLVTNATINPQGLLELLGPQFLPGLDGFQVLDVRKYNTDGSENEDYAKVVNFVQLPLPFGIENEPHHMQYEWEDGDPIIAGALFTSSTWVMDVNDIPNVKLKNNIPLTESGYSIPDAYDAVGDGRFIGTYMGGPVANFGGSPGAIAVFKPDAQKGLALESVTPAGNILATSPGGKNAGGVPEPCSVQESRPLGTCANPHGIQIRQDLKTMITSDYAEPREIVLDPIKTLDKYTFRPTIRTWDTSNPAAPRLTSVAHAPVGWRQPAQRAHENYGIMENAKTWPTTKDYPQTLPSKGAFAGSMCGGGVFFTPDISKLKGDASDKWVQVWDDGLSNLQGKEEVDKFLDQPGDCAGGAWHQVSRDNKWFFRSVQGRNPGGDNYFDQGASKQIYDLNIEDLIKSAQDGKVACDLTKGIDTNGDGKVDLSAIKAVHKLAQGQKIADCPTLIDTLPVKDITSGGPHWAALDNHSYNADGSPTRLTFSNYFVSRTGVDGDHRYYLVNIAKDGKLSYDEDFRDEKTGALGVNFNRRDWPGTKDGGFYKPHSMVWITPKGISPKGEAPLPVLPPDAPATKKAKKAALSASGLKAALKKLRTKSSTKVKVKAKNGAVSKVKIVVKKGKRTVATAAAKSLKSGKSGTWTLKRANSKALKGKGTYTVTISGSTSVVTASTGKSGKATVKRVLKVRL